MFDFRLKVFYTVARRLNFSRAAEELFITQPAVSKHIQEIERFYQTTLFERKGTRITLTKAGDILLKHVEELMSVYRAIDFELSTLSEEVKGTLRVGASTTVAQYFLPEYLASFKKKFPEVNITLISGNTEEIENLITDHHIDLGIVEGVSKRSYLKYAALVKDELVLCSRHDNPLIKKSSINLSELQKLPLVVREAGSGSLEVMNTALKEAGLRHTDLNIELSLQSIESIKSYLVHANAFAFLSVHSVIRELKANAFKIVDVKGVNIERYFYFIAPQGATSGLQELFHKHLKSHNLKL